MAAASAMFAGGALFPWQRLVADVAGEKLPDGSFAYDEVIIVVGRRAGKTRLTHGVPLRRGIKALSEPIRHPVTGRRTPYLAAATAQNMTSAAKRLRETWDTFRTAAPTAAALSRHLTGVNHAAIELDWRRRVDGRWQANQWASRLSVFPPTAHAVRGDEYQFVSVDESLVLSVEDGQDIYEAAGPALSTFPGAAQMWWLSNEGKDARGWLAQLKERGRAVSAAGVNTGTAYFEWSMADDDDPENPDTWHRVHPAMGYVLSESQCFRDLEKWGVDAFAREYLCKESKAADQAAIDPAQWAATALQDTAPPPPPGSLAFGVDVAKDRSRASLAAAYIVDGVMYWSILWTGPPHMLFAEVRAQAAALRPKSVHFDHFSAGSIAAEGYSWWTPIQVRELTAACAGVIDRLGSNRLVHAPHFELDDAAAAAVTRPISDAGFAWGRRASAGSIAPLVACTLAGHGAETGNVRPTIVTRRNIDG